MEWPNAGRGAGHPRRCTIGFRFLQRIGQDIDLFKSSGTIGFRFLQW
jgi:hypothetical protein